MCMICKFAYQCHIGLLKSYRYFMTYRDMIPLHLTSDHFYRFHHPKYFREQERIIFLFFLPIHVVTFLLKKYYFFQIIVQLDPTPFHHNSASEGSVSEGSASEGSASDWLTPKGRF